MEGLPGESGLVHYQAVCQDWDIQAGCRGLTHKNSLSSESAVKNATLQMPTGLCEAGMGSMERDGVVGKPNRYVYEIHTQIFKLYSITWMKTPFVL